MNPIAPIWVIFFRSIIIILSYLKKAPFSMKDVFDGVILHAVLFILLLLYNSNRGLMLDNFTPCSKQSLFEEMQVKQPSSIRGYSKQSEIYELPQYQVTSHRSIAAKTPLSKICTLAFINQQNKLEINAQAFQIVSEYAKFQLIFCGVYGAKNSGKSTFIDHFMKSDVTAQTGFKSQSKSSTFQSLIINRKPISLNTGKKMFFIEYQRGFESNILPQKSLKLLDLLMFLSNSLVIIVNKTDLLKPIINHIQFSAQRLKFDSQNINFWPQNVYIIDNYNSVGRDIAGIDHFFRRTSLILWNKGQAKSLQRFFQDISMTGDNKSIKGISNNFHITKKLAYKLQLQQNLTKNGQLSIEKIFQQVYQQLCNQYLLYHQQLYDSTLQHYFVDEKPYKVDYLIECFEKCRQTIIQHFKQNNIVKESHDEQLQKLQDFIDQRERLIVQVNKKKSQFQLKKQISNISAFKHKFPKQVDVQIAINGFRELNERFEHAGVEIYASSINQMVRNIEKGHRKLAKKAEQQYQSTILDLQRQIEQSNQHLKSLKSAHSEAINNMKEDQRKLQQLTGTVNKLRKQLQLQRKTHKQIFNGKLSAQQKIDKLLVIIRQLEEKVRQNSKVIRNIEQQYDFDPEIQRLKRKVERFQREKNAQGFKLESAKNSMIDPQTKTQISLEAKTKQTTFRQR